MKFKCPITGQMRELKPQTVNLTAEQLSLVIECLVAMEVNLDRFKSPRAKKKREDVYNLLQEICK